MRKSQMSKRFWAIAALAALGMVALVAAGCGSSDSSSTSTTVASSTAATSSGGAASLEVADNPDLGQILTDGDGNTVYLFEKDQNGKSSCSGSCAAAWPPVTTTGNAQAGDGVDSSLISTTKRDDGSEQVTYDGHPLYLYEGDTSPGDTTGNGLDQFGAEWYALTPDGSNAEGDESGSSEDSTSSDSGSGSTY
jgi:predicted lipoprotein with Yx(FWY)xxD motif